MATFKKQLLVMGVLASLPMIQAEAGNGTNGSATSTFPVSATVANTCQAATSSGLSFGTYNPFSTTALTGTTTINVTCTSGDAYTVELSKGTGSGALFTNRVMTGPAGALLNYNLYQDSGYSNVWGDISSGKAPPSVTGSGSVQSYTVYGQILTGQNVVAGSYSDTITITVAY